MATVLVIDTLGDSRPALERAFVSAGWKVAAASDPAAGRRTPADAIVLIADTAGLASALAEVQAVRRAAGTPVVLVTDLDRSGWDRTFGSAEGLDVEALFDRPADAAAMVRRIDGILAARRAVRAPDLARMSAILDRAVANEESAAAFYRLAAGSAADPATRDVLFALARDEEEHKRLIDEFKSGRRALPEGTTVGGSLVEMFGTPDPSIDLSPADAFLLAARKEKLAVEFYQNWASLYPGGPERDLLLRLAEIERRHKARVEALFANAAFPEAW